MPKGYGLNLLPLKVSLLFVIISTSLFAFINSLEISLGVSIASIAILLLGRRLVFKKIFFYVLIINSIYMILGNWLFSPNALISDNYLFFRINDTGLHNGIVGALKRNAMIVLSFAWLSSIASLYEVYNSINVIKKFNKTIIVFLKWIQNLKHDFTLLYYSMYIRGFDLKSKNPRKKIKQLIVILKAVLNRFFTNIGKMTYNGESHFNFIGKDNENNKGTVEINNLTVSYDSEGQAILENVNLSISEGEVVFISGNNGCGKTTLLKVISGYIPKVEGYIFNGEVVVSNISLNSKIQLKEINKHLRYIVENPVDSIIGLNVKQELSSQTGDEKIINYYSELLDIVHLWERDTNTLSGGEQARVVLASLLCSNVKLLVLESPLGQLDPLGRNSFISALHKIIESKKVTVIITDQYADYYNGLINRFIFLENGNIKHDLPTNKGQIIEILDKLSLTYPSLKPFVHSTNNKDVVASIRNISLSFDSKKVLTNISCNFYQNQCVAIMGDNGSGKSTLLLSIAKVLIPDVGDVLVNFKSIGMVFQDCSKQILEDKTSEEIVLALKNEGVDEKIQEQYTNEMLNWSQLTENQSTLDISVSKIRLLEISSNIYNKSIIILDEPTNYLDRNNIVKLHSFIQELLNLGKTILIVTHDNQLASLCSRFILMHKSEIVLDTEKFEDLLLKRKFLSHA